MQKGSVLRFGDRDVLERRRDAQSFHANLGDASGKAVANEGRSRELGIQCVAQGNVQSDAISFHGVDHPIGADHAARADPGLRLAVADQRVHAHEMDPFGGHRAEHQHAIAGMEVPRRREPEK